MVSLESSTYRFAEFELQPRERRLLKAGVAVPLTPKVLDLLELLVSRAGHVVSKDELLTTLWPNRFVTEANLTKHVWTLRRALGEPDDGDRFIETISKVGYRFTGSVVPVPVGEATPLAPSVRKIASEPAIRHLRPFWIGAAATLLFAVVALGAWWLWNGRQPSFPWSSEPPGTVVAIVEFDNLSHSRSMEWVGPAFVEMLGTEIALGGHLHLVPDRLVRDAQSRLSDRIAAGYAPSDLTELRRRLVADIIVTGSYWAPQQAGQPLKLDVTVQDARTGATLATLSRSAVLDNLPNMVVLIGTDLRKVLGAPAQTSADDLLAANAQPPTVDIMRRMGNALNALHHYEPARARDELLQAVAQAPDYAPAYAYLSRAWSELGYHDRAVAAAAQALAHDANLPKSVQLQIAAQAYAVRYDWPHAIEALRELSEMDRNNPEIAFDLSDVLLKSGNPKEAQHALDDIAARNPSVKDDPRFELAVAQIAANQDDTLDRKVHAERALGLAQARGQAGLMADAERQIGIVLTSSDPAGAGEALARSIDNYRTVNNPRGEAEVHRDLGNLFLDSNPPRARQEYQRSLAQFQTLGDQNGIAAAYSDLASTLWAAGDRDAAEVAVQNVLSIRRSTGDVAGQAWALAALAIERSDESASDEAVDGLRKAAALDAGIGAHAHRAFSLYNLSDVLRVRGALSEAADICRQAQAEYAAINDPSDRALADFECAQIALDRGDLRTSETGLAASRASAVHRADAMTLGNADMTEGQIRMGQRQWGAAATLVSRARDEFASAQMITGKAVALGLLAQCESELGDIKGRDRDRRDAASLRSQITERGEIFQLDITLAALDGGAPGQAATSLAVLAADARQRQWPGLALEAELAERDVLLAANQTAQANVLSAAIARDARARGYGWVMARLAS